MSEHEYFEELGALAAGGFLSDQELAELREHTRACPQCLKSEEQFSAAFCSALPLTGGRIQEFLERLRIKLDEGLRARFLERASREGVVFSPDIRLSAQGRAIRLGRVLAGTAALAAVALLASYGTRVYRRGGLEGSAEAKQQIIALQERNATLNATLSEMNDALAAQKREIQNLRAQLGIAAKTEESLRQENESRSASRNVQLPEELENRDKQLEDARKEIARINQLHVNDETSLLAQQVRIVELSDQLRVASATLDLERQLTAAGKDIRELLTARQLHVIDVRDTDVNGKPGKAFGRIFVTEGKSLTFYAFDLNEERPIDAKHRFEVWGSQQAKGSPAHNLGFLYEDDRAQRRWALKVNDPQLVKEIDSVFVTVEPAGGGATPSKQGLLYAYLGQPNHP